VVGISELIRYLKLFPKLWNVPLWRWLYVTY
jgi:hypothetical protein